MEISIMLNTIQKVLDTANTWIQYDYLKLISYNQSQINLMLIGAAQALVGNAIFASVILTIVFIIYKANKEGLIK